jgi:hypothetical protein
MSHKQGHFLPGVHIPIHEPEWVRDTRPDYLLILPWNIREEVMQEKSYTFRSGGSLSFQFLKCRYIHDFH